MEELNQISGEIEDNIHLKDFSTKSQKIKNSNPDYFDIISTSDNSEYIQSHKDIIKFKPYLAVEKEHKYDELFHLEKKLEEVHIVKINYLKFQNEFNTRKRFILIDWIMEVCYQFHFCRKTYFSCINLIDIYFTKCKVKTNQIQLVGIACLLISAKNEETEIPKLSYFSLVCQNLYTKSEILKKESEILLALNWRIQYINLFEVVNIFMLKWDNIVNLLNKDKNNSYNMPIFRNDPQYKDLLLTHFYNFLDNLSLDYYYNFYDEKYLCVAIAYVVIGVVKSIFAYSNCINSFNKAKIYNNEKIKKYRNNFFNICENYLKINTIDILNELKYICIVSSNIQGMCNDNIRNRNKFYDDKNNELQTYNNHNFENYKKLEKIRKEGSIN